jgi:hypothetical protein
MVPSMAGGAESWGRVITGKKGFPTGSAAWRHGRQARVLRRNGASWERDGSFMIGL